MLDAIKTVVKATEDMPIACTLSIIATALEVYCNENSFNVVEVSAMLHNAICNMHDE